MTFGQKLHSLRKGKAMSQEQLAIELSVSRQAISKWELGDATPETDKVLLVAKYFQVSTDYLLNDTLPNIEDKEPDLLLKEEEHISEIDMESSNYLESKDSYSKTLCMLTVAIPILNMIINSFHSKIEFSSFVLPLMAAFISVMIYIMLEFMQQKNDYTMLAGFNKNKKYDYKVLKKMVSGIEFFVLLFNFIYVFLADLLLWFHISQTMSIALYMFLNLGMVGTIFLMNIRYGNTIYIDKTLQSEKENEKGFIPLLVYIALIILATMVMIVCFGSYKIENNTFEALIMGGILLIDTAFICIGLFYESYRRSSEEKSKNEIIQKRAKMILVITVILSLVFKIVMVIVANALTTEEPILALTRKEEERYIALAKTHSEMMLENDFKGIMSLMTKTTQSKITSEELREGWDDTVVLVGEYLDEMTVELLAKGDKGIVINTRLHFESRDILLTLSYQEEKIKAIFLKPVEKIIEIIYPYTEEEILVGEHKLKGILTLPEDVENPPIVVMVLDSGPGDMDFTIGDNKPMKDIANGLAEAGIASIRYNKRYFQLPEISMAEEVTIYTEYLDDTAKAIDLAGEIGSDIFVVGHGQGGMCVPKIAHDNPEVKGIVSMAGTYRELRDFIYEQMFPFIEIANISEEEKKEELKILEEDYEKSKNMKKGDTASGMPYSYWSSLEELDTLNLSKTLELPMLFLQGSDDIQVYTDKNFESWENELVGKVNTTFVLYEGLNHFFMESTYGGEVNSAEYDEPKTVDSQVIKDLAIWIKEN